MVKEDVSGSFARKDNQQTQDFTISKKKITRNSYARSGMYVLMGLFITKCP